MSGDMAGQRSSKHRPVDSIKVGNCHSGCSLNIIRTVHLRASVRSSRCSGCPTDHSAVCEGFDRTVEESLHWQGHLLVRWFFWQCDTEQVATPRLTQVPQLMAQSEMISWIDLRADKRSPLVEFSPKEMSRHEKLMRG
jgi:hypothetical protein